MSPAYSFDGSNDYIHLFDHDTADELGRSFSISLWFQSTNDTSGDGSARLITRDASEYWSLYVDQSAALGTGQDLTLVYADGDSEIFADAVTGEWQHATIVWREDSSGDTVQFYLDGRLLQTFDQGRFANADRPVIIGDNTEQSPRPGASPFEGAIDDVRIYGQALRETEVLILYTEGGYVPPVRELSASAGNEQVSPHFSHTRPDGAFRLNNQRA
jgi:uncharacterized membrane protein